MAAYAAVISLKNTIHLLLYSSPAFLILPGIQSSLKSAYKELESLQKAVERLDYSGVSSRSSKWVSYVEEQIRDAVYKLEDALESQISNHFPPQSESLGGENLPLLFVINWKNLRQRINSLAEMKKEYIRELSYRVFPKHDDAANSYITTDFGGKKSKMVGLSVEYSNLKDRLSRGRNLWDKAVSLVGMAGVGKTTLAKEIFEDPAISNYFECRAWVTVGQTYQPEKIVQTILDQVNPNRSEMLMEEKELCVCLSTELKSRRYLIVLDDLWDGEIWEYLKKLFPEDREESRVLVTTRLEQVSSYVSNTWKKAKMSSLFRYNQINQIKMRLLDEEESWNLLHEKVFAEELCPPQLEKAGKEIAENCDGLPLVIVTVAELLSKAEKTVECWKKIAKRDSSVFREAYDRTTKVLISSYHYLSQYLKACFLYMGVFPQNYKIPTSKLINLCSAEGFVKTDHLETVGEFTMKCLKNLVSDNLLVVRQQSYDGRIKTCSLHSAFWQMCIRIAGKDKFLHVLNSYGDGLAESIKGQRRLCVHNCILFGIKDVYNSMASISASRSLLCTGQRLQYPVPICLGLRLLRVLDALTIRFYKFPMEVLNLVHLRYLALTYNGKLPASISKLRNLQFLIVHQHLSIKSPAESSYLPVEIWDMKELKHLQIMGSDLPEPNGFAFLQNLSTLLDVSVCSCTRVVLGNIHHIKKLGIRIEVAPDAAELLSCLGNISNLYSLKSLKCVIENPILMSEIVAPPAALLSMLPSTLKKLSLSGFGYEWKHTSKIASLSNLKVLKLRCYAFRGPKWETREERFLELEYLLIEDTDLVHWRCHYQLCFPSLKRLVIRHCYKLQEIPQMSQFSDKLEMIEVVDSTPSVVTWVKQLPKET